MNKDNELRGIIRQNLIRMRKEAGKTQSDIAKYCGKSENAVGSWEQGLSLPDIITLAKLARLYNVSIDQMYEEVKQ